ncbi:MAG: zinc uptake protein ZrgA [Pseudochelatococcus sp.]|jgi:hypothetical protein|uniref:zinc uptake protein ZrgA n=1 Tax=Pseudochelatococcus sp. TaxID=2020869 RepID=UPI003D938D25
MKRLAIATLALFAATSAFGEERRELGAHEHGVSRLDVAVEGNRISAELHAPGADITGFEHEAESAEDRAALERAIATLEKPLDLFVLPQEAQCTVTEAKAHLEGEGEHDHGHEAHEGEKTAGEKTAGGHADDRHAHDEEKPGEEKHGHDDHAHEGGEGAQHSEFHAEYVLTCANPAAIARIEFAYFEAFPNAREIEIRLVTEKGAQSFEVRREAPALDLKGRM